MSKPWLFSSERQPARQNHRNVARNLAASHHAARERVLARRVALIGMMRGQPPMTAAELWRFLSGETLTPRAAANKLACRWGVLKEEGRLGVVGRMYKAFGWPPPKRGNPRPKRVTEEEMQCTPFVTTRERWARERLANWRAGC